MIVLLRAVNVGKRTLHTEEFRELLRRVGCTGIATVGAAGSAVVVSPPHAPPAVLERLLEREVVAVKGWESDVVVRTGTEWAGIVSANPFGREASSAPAYLHLCLLKRPPETGSEGRLRSAIAGRERFSLGVRHLYLVYPDGAGRSKLTLAAIERAVGTSGTSRNWNTVGRLRTLAAAGVRSLDGSD